MLQINSSNATAIQPCRFNANHAHDLRQSVSGGVSGQAASAAVCIHAANLLFALIKISDIAGDKIMYYSHNCY